MILLSRLSLRSVTNAVFMVAAVWLCTILVVQINAAIRADGQSERLAAIAGANRASFKAVQELPGRIDQLLASLANRDDAASIIPDIPAKPLSVFDIGLTAARHVDGVEGEKLSIALQSRWDALKAGWRDAATLAHKPKAERESELTAIIPLVSDYKILARDLGKLSLAIDSDARLVDSSLDAYVEVTRLGWKIQASSSSECALTRPLLGNARALTAEEWAKINRWRGNADAGLARLDDLLARPGIAQDLAAANTRAIVTKIRASRDEVFMRLDGSGKPAATIEEFVQICTLPLDGIYQKMTLGTVELITAATRAARQSAQADLVRSALP
jgi:hypothetical protein